MDSVTIIIWLISGIITLICIFIGITIGQRSQFGKFDSGEDYARGGEHKPFKEYKEESHTDYQSYNNESHKEFKEYSPHNIEDKPKTVVYQNKDKKTSGCCLILLIVIVYFFIMIGSGVFNIFKTASSLLNEASHYKNIEFTTGDTSSDEDTGEKLEPEYNTTLLEEFAFNSIDVLDYYSISEIMEIIQKLKTRKRIRISDYTPDHPVHLSFFNKSEEDITGYFNSWGTSIEELDKKDYFLSNANFFNDKDNEIKFTAFIPLNVGEIYSIFDLSDLLIQYFKDPDESISCIKIKTPKSETVIKKEDLAKEDMFWDLNDKLEDLYKEFADDYNYTYKIYEITNDCISIVTVEDPNGVY